MTKPRDRAASRLNDECWRRLSQSIVLLVILQKLFSVSISHTLPHTLGSSQWLILLDQYEQHHHSPVLHTTWSLPAAGGVTDIVPCFSDAHLQTRAACRWAGLGPGWGLWPGDRPAAPGSPSAPGPPESTSLPAGELRAPPSASGSPAEHTHTFIHTCINEPHKYSVRKSSV